MKCIKIIIGGLFFAVLIITKVYAANFQDVVINELAWAGSSISTADEWIELKNMTNQDIDLSNWQITYLNSKKETLSSTIESGIFNKNNFFLIASHSENHVFSKGSSVLNITPDVIEPDLTLSNSYLEIKIFDNFNNLIDTAGNRGKPFNYNDNQNDNKISLERNLIISDGTLASSWHSAIVSINFDDGILDKGTSKAENIEVSPSPTPTPTPTLSPSLSPSPTLSSSPTASLSPSPTPSSSPTASPSPSPTPSSSPIPTPTPSPSPTPIIYENTVIINEFLPDPTSKDSEGEWIELYNTSNHSVDLSNWILDDAEGGSKPYKIPTGTTILANDYLVIKITESKISLNNSGDSVRLFFPNNLLADQVNYGKSKENYSYARKDDNSWAWNKNLTPDAKNIFIDDNTNNSGTTSSNQNTIIDNINIGQIDSELKNYLVEIEGIVTRLNGQTFYISDESGEIRITIKKSANFKRPPMSKNDKVRITGLVYCSKAGCVVYPRMIDDIKIIEKYVKPKIESQTKKSNKTKSKKQNNSLMLNKLSDDNPKNTLNLFSISSTFNDYNDSGLSDILHGNYYNKLKTNFIKQSIYVLFYVIIITSVICIIILGNMIWKLHSILPQQKKHAT